MSHFYKIFLALFGVCVITSVFMQEAHAVKIIPPRLVIDSDTQIEHMFIKNNAKKTEAYRFGWKHMAMDKEGNILNLDKLGMDQAPEGYQPIDKIVRVSPRRAVLKPGQTQRVTFVLRRSADLPAGEYRSHFLVERVPMTQGQTLEEKDLVTAKDKISEGAIGEADAPTVSFDVMVSRAVPIYVLNGKTEASLKLLNMDIKPNIDKKRPRDPTHVGEFRVQKTGNRSVIGKATIYCTSGGEEIQISTMPRIFAVYAEGEFRNEKIAINMPAKACSSKRIEIVGHPDDVLKGQVLVNQKF